MKTTVWAYGGKTSLKCLLFCILIFLTLVPASMAVDVPSFTPYFNDVPPVSGYGIDRAHYNVSVQLAERVSPNTTPWELWSGAIVLALVLFLYSLRPINTMHELESSIIVAVLAALSSAYASFASFGIDRISGYGVTSQIINQTSQVQAIWYNHEYVYMEQHLTYSEPVVGVLMAILFFIIVGFTIYRIGTHRAFVGDGDNI